MTTQPQLTHTAWPIRRLTPADLPDCLLLAQDRHWPAEEHKWRLLFAVGDVHGIDDPAGGLAAVVVSTRYDRELATIGMMVVAARHERQGLGKRLMCHALANTDATTIWLTATDYGRPLYEKIGFRAIDHCTTYSGHFRPHEPTALRSRPVTEADLPALSAMDAEVFGATRAEVLRRLPTFLDDFRLVEGPNGPTGYGGRWRNTDNTVIGPVIANDLPTARTLLSDLAVSVAGPVRLDLMRERPEQLTWATAHGLQPRGTTTVMIHGDALPGDRSRLFNPLMIAMG
ncbi:MAG TPA: GNAT family N-acetyltransferase [Pseudonocardiaceae bacterium]|nr:GNAT family N-acetyltransferase [Pseudonocardiaceae bacterium]